MLARSLAHGDKEAPMTYSIVARDPATGELGVGVQTAAFAVGAVVTWARAGVGAVATQAIAEPAYGPRCLDALARGDSASAALDAARSLDPMAVVRQVGVVDAGGDAAAFTGDLCIDSCGHLVGDGWAVQANMMSNGDVWSAMAAAFEASRPSGQPLARRLLETLRAAQDAGGDARGEMSAALLVVDGQRQDDPWVGRRVDLRVDRHDRPLDELARLLDAAEAYHRMDEGVEALIAGDGERALAALDQGLAVLPGEENLRFPRVGALMMAGRERESVAELQALVGSRPTWAGIVRSFAAKGLIVLPEGLEL
jgi:uncharacterized Ntn-hydrolase superfamily protein